MDLPAACASKDENLSKEDKNKLIHYIQHPAVINNPKIDVDAFRDILADKGR